MRRLISITMLLALASMDLLAQGPPPPPPPSPPLAPGRDAQSPALTKGKGVIRGRVVSADTGKPLRRARVYLATGGGESRNVSTGTSGSYEIKDLPPGRYTLRVTRSGYLALTHGQKRPGEPGRPIELADAQVMEKIDFAMPRMGVITGRVLDEVGEPVAEAQVWAMQMRYYLGRRRLVPAGGGFNARTDDAGQYRILGLAPGEYVVMANLRDTWPLDDDPTQILGYTQTYYPGTANPAEAQRVKVGVGQEVGAIDLGLVPGRAAKLSGVAITSTGAPATGQTVGIGQEITGPTMSSMMSVGSGKVAGDGSWSIPNVPPGEYRMTLRAAVEGQDEHADMMVVVGGGDMEGITLVTGTGGTLRGLVVTEDNTPLAGPLERLVVRARTVATDFRPRQPNVSGDNGRVGKDGTFEFKGAFGPTVLSVNPLPAGWVVKAIEYEGRDVADGLIDVKHGDAIAGIRVVLTNRPTVVRGAIRDEKTQAPADGTVILFATDSAKWREESRSIRSARPDQNGRFEVRGLPPGEYLAVALDYVQDGQWNDPEFLEGLKSIADRFTLNESETKALDLNVQK